MDILSIILIIGGFSLVVLAAHNRYNYWKSQGKRLQESGYLVPAPTIFSIVVMQAVAKIAAFVMTGPIKVIRVRKDRLIRKSLTVALDETDSSGGAAGNLVENSGAVPGGGFIGGLIENRDESAQDKVKVNDPALPSVSDGAQIEKQKDVCLLRRDRRIIVANHIDEADFTVLAKALRLTPFRYLAEIEQLGGNRAAFCAITGAIGVDKSSVEGRKKVIGSCVKALVEDGRKPPFGLPKDTSRLLIFPQGTLVRDNKLSSEQFKKGAITMAKLADREVKAEDKLEGNVFIQPVGVHYLRDARHATWFHKLMLKLGWKNFRQMFPNEGEPMNYGAIVVVGDPVAISEFPSNTNEANEMMFRQILALVEIARTQDKYYT
jgi:1-acyl-sn-glycerol-3-phosphate acyltransferase